MQTIHRKRDAHGDTITVEEHERIVSDLVRDARGLARKSDPSKGETILLADHDRIVERLNRRIDRAEKF